MKEIEGQKEEITTEKIEEEQKKITSVNIDKLDQNDIDFFSKNVPKLPDDDGNRNDMSSVIASNIQKDAKGEEIVQVACFQIISLMCLFFCEELRKNILSIDLTILEDNSPWKSIFKAMKIALLNPKSKIENYLEDNIINKINNFLKIENVLKKGDTLFRFFEVFSFLLTDSDDGKNVYDKKLQAFKYQRGDDNIKMVISKNHKLNIEEEEIFTKFRLNLLHWKFFKTAIDNQGVVDYLKHEKRIKGNLEIKYNYNNTFCTIHWDGHAFFIQKYGKQYYISKLLKPEPIKTSDEIKNDIDEKEEIQEDVNNAISFMEKYKANSKQKCINEEDEAYVFFKTDYYLENKEIELINQGFHKAGYVGLNKCTIEEHEMNNESASKCGCLAFLFGRNK